MRQFILISILTFQTYCQCEFLDYVVKIDDSINYQNYSVNFTVSQQTLDGEMNIGFGVWIKYQPYKIYAQGIFKTIPSRNFFDEGRRIERRKEQFIFSMMQEDFQTSQILLTFSYIDDIRMFQYQIYTDFINSADKYIQNIDPSQIEGQWYMFYFYSDLIQKNTNLGFFCQQQNTWLKIEIQDIPLFTSSVKFYLGGGIKIEKYKQEFFLFERFYGTLSSVFTTFDYNLIQNEQFDSCEIILQFIYPCFEDTSAEAHSDDHLNGDKYLNVDYSYAQTKSFIINGWVKLDPISFEKERETVIMRITINENYNNDEYLGDRFIYLQYFQNIIPQLNGVRISTQGYKIPIYDKYQTQPEDIMESFDEDYEQLLTLWHIIQFEKGTINNNGYPVFSLYIPYRGIKQLQWNQNFNYFSQPTFHFYLGGDKFSKNYIKGYLQHFQYQVICSQISLPIMISCFVNCETCDGPTKNSCLSCFQGSNRYFDEQTKSCLLQENYYEIASNIIKCQSFQDFGLIAIGDYQQISQEDLNFCQQGYIFIKNQCFQCPYYQEYQSKVQILCADCYVNQKQFIQTLTCTFDYISYQYQKLFVYQQNNRSLDLIEIYTTDEQKQKLTKLQQTKYNQSFTCQKQQIYKNNQCLTIKHCISFEIINNIQINCESCEQGYFLEGIYCIECGNFCKSCNSFGLCNYCFDSSQYYLTFNGINCQSCQIKYCKYCFQYQVKMGKIYTTLDFDFYIQNYDNILVQDGCALCYDGYFFNFQTNQCEVKCQNLLIYDQTQQCQKSFSDCKFGIIDMQSNIQCIQSQQSQNSILIEDCNQLQNCYQCTNQLKIGENQKCIICKLGYYVEIVSGKCFSCPEQCTHCIQQSIQQQDYWKQQVYGFYKILNDENHPFEYYSINIAQKMEIKCLECISGYVRYENTCIKDCDSFCKQCIIQEGKSVCIQCWNKERGFLRSKDNNGTCIECPSGCAACVERSLNEIQDYNPYFILTSNNIPYSRKCFEVFDNNANQNQLFLDDQNMILIQCQNENSCMNQMKFQIDVYCSYLDTYADNQYSSKIQSTLIYLLFSIENQINETPIFGLSYYFSYQMIEQYLYDILNSLSTQKMDIYLNFIQGQNDSCIIDSNYSIFTHIQKYVFSVKEVNLYFIGSKPNTILYFKGDFYIHNFSRVVFKNFQISFNTELFNLQNQIIHFDSKIKLGLFAFENCIFTTLYFEDTKNVNIEFQSNAPINLIIQNVIFYNFYISNSNLFSTQTNNSKMILLQIDNLLIENSILSNSTFYQIVDNKNQQYSINCSQLTIIKSAFFNSSIIQIINVIKQKQDSQFAIHSVKIQNSEFNHSIIFKAQSIVNFKIIEFEIINCSFKQNTIIISTLYINITDVKLTSITNLNSSFISNYQHDQNQQQEDIPQNISLFFCFTRVTLIDIITDNLQSFILFDKAYQNFETELNLLEISLENIQSISNYPIQKFLGYQAALLAFDCKFFFAIKFRTRKSFGVIELALVNTLKIEFHDIQVQQTILTQRKFLHPMFDCIFSNLLPYVSFLIIAFYKEVLIDQLVIENCYSLNYPIIQIQGQDVKYQQVEEFIKISNSIFQNNIIIVTDSEKESSLLYIVSQQNNNIQIQNVTFDGNMLHHYIQSLSLKSSTTILINLQQGQINLIESKFIKNLALNTTNSILAINSFSLIMKEVEFWSNNILLNSSISRILFVEQITSSLLENLFLILSNGGNGQLISNNIELINLTVFQSSSSNGGSFYIKTNLKGKIQIRSSNFMETRTQFYDSYNSKGGCFYIDASQSSLNFTLINSLIKTTSSQISGGCIYIIPSKISNIILIKNISVKDSFSLQHYFFSLSYSFIQNTLSSILFENINFSQTKEGYQNFYSNFKIVGIYKSSQMIYINYGNITMKNISLINAYNQQLLKFEEVQIIELYEIIIRNNTYLNSPLIEISLSKNYFSQIIAKKIVLWNIQVFNDILPEICENAENQKNEKLVECPKIDVQNWQVQILQVNNSAKELNQFICNQKSIFQTPQYLNTLINFIITGNNQSFFLENAQFQYIKCLNCNSGVFLTLHNQGNLQLKEIKFKHNSCGNQGCLSVIGQQKLSNDTRLLFSESKFELNKQIKSNIYLIMDKCQFQNNTSNLGGALYLDSTSSLIIDSLFSDNNAQKGGSIYYTSKSSQLQLINTIIRNNIAQIAGGIFIYQQALDLTYSLNIQIFDNIGQRANQDLSENPQQLTISLDGGVSFLNKSILVNNAYQVIEKIQIEPYQIFGSQQFQKYLMLPSGIAIRKYSYFDEQKLIDIPYNLSFRVIALNQFYQPEIELEGSFCTIQHKIIEILTGKQEDHLVSNISISQVFFNISSNDFNLDDLIIYFNPQYSQNYFLRLIIQCNVILIPIFDQNQTFSVINYNSNYQLYLDIQSFPCQIGEYLNLETGGCVYCDPQQNLYSLTKDSKNCTYKDNELIDQFTSSKIQLRIFYWRASNNSTKIEYCYHLQENCQGGWIPGDESCALGHIGALCEQCDLYNIRGWGAYSVSSQYSCGSCQKLTENTLIILVLFIWVFISIFLSVNSTVQNIEQMILSLRLKFLGISNQPSKASTAILVKLFTNYLQIITTIQTFQLKIPNILIGIYSGFGNPVVQMSYSWDCFIVHITDIDIIYFRILWNIFNACAIFILFTLFECLKQTLSSIKFNISHLYTALLYIYTYIHPSIIGMLMSQLSYREISDIKWIQGNVSYKYVTNVHKQWLLCLILPLSLFLGIIIPLFLFYKIHINKNHLDKSIIKKKWGYLINEYKKESYFWDIVKILQRQIIIVLFTYYDDFIPVKASLVVIILFFYSLLQASNQPYKTKKLNSIEGGTMKICSTSIILGSCIYQTQQYQMQEIVWLFYFLISSLNIYQFFYFIFLIVRAYFSQFQKALDYLPNNASKYCPKFILQLPLFQKTLIKNYNKKRKVLYYFHKIRQIILPQVRTFLNFKNSIQFSHCNSPQMEIFHQMISQDENITKEKKINQLLIGSLQNLRQIKSLKV